MGSRRREPAELIRQLHRVRRLTAAATTAAAATGQ